MHAILMTTHFHVSSLSIMEIACLRSWKNLANESLRNCDERQVLRILTISCRFKFQNVCIFQKFSSFQLFQSEIEIIIAKCCREVIVSLELVFFQIFRV